MFDVDNVQLRPYAAKRGDRTRRERLPVTEIPLALRLHGSTLRRADALVEWLNDVALYATIATVTRSTALRLALLYALEEYEEEYKDLADSLSQDTPASRTRPAQNVAGREHLALRVPDFLIARVDHLIPALEQDKDLASGPISRATVVRHLIAHGVGILERKHMPADKRPSPFAGLAEVDTDWARPHGTPGRLPNRSRKTTTPSNKENP